MRSLLFVPGDSTRKFESAVKTAADVLLLDLEDSVAPDRKEAARDLTLEMLGKPRGRQKFYVRINAFDTELWPEDLAAVMPGCPDGIMLPKCVGAADVNKLAACLDQLESVSEIEPGTTRILIVASESAQAVLKLMDFGQPSPRLAGMLWGAEDLAASLGALGNKVEGRYTEPFLLARNLCLMAAAAAGVAPIDAVYTDINNLDGLKQEALAARHDGFLAKAVIHPKHVDIVNGAFMPSDDEIAWSKQVVAAFAQNPNAGVVTIDGKMIDKPHLRAALKILAQAAV